MAQVVALVSLLLFVVVNHVAANSVVVEQKKVSIGSRSISARVVRVPLDSYSIKIGLAQGRVGLTESLSSIARRYNAVAAINGCFFDAYVKGPVKVPWHNLITNGEVVHIGDTGTTLGFDSNGDYRMDHARIRIRGTLGETKNWSSSWYAYLVNHPGSAVVFNRYWAGSKTPYAGSQVVVADDTVKSISSGCKSIPSDGYVIAYSGGETSLAGRFKQEQKCSYKVNFEGVTDPDFWSNVTEAIGCGPTLVKQGEVYCNPASEGFSSSKILNASGARSAIGVTSNRTLLLVTCNVTIQQLARVMKSLGAYDAMNLDGGASSGLYANGRMLVSPGRLISNAVVVVKK